MDIQSTTPIQKGKSRDLKYRALTSDGTPCLLRYSVRLDPEEKAREFSVLRELYKAGVPLPEPLEWGKNAKGCYHLEQWIEGKTLDTVLPTLTSEEQYALGIEAGHILRQIHGAPIPSNLENWDTHFHRACQKKFDDYCNCPLRYPDDQVIFDSLKKDLPLMVDRPQVLRHGDYHPGNMMRDPSGKLWIIDFHKWGYGDPLEDLRLINRAVTKAPRFASGLIDGYVQGPVPHTFWRILRFYVAEDLIFLLPWAVKRGDAEVADALVYAAEVREVYQNFTRLIPSWYEVV